MMHQSNDRKSERVTQEQMAEIIGAILSGKYSWACVLMLTYLGYEPMHYLPDRTMSRLTKENGFPRQPLKSADKPTSIFSKKQDHRLEDFNSSQRRGTLRDLSHLEPVGSSAKFLTGGKRSSYPSYQLDCWTSFDAL